MANWGGAATGAVGGATTGSTFGPIGAAVGAGLGGLLGLFKKKPKPQQPAAPTGMPGGSSVPGLSPAMEQELMALMQMGRQRNMSTQPVHEAAMRMAMAMAPDYSRRGRMDQAIGMAGAPRARRTTSPAVMEAIQHLMQTPRV